jgi:ribosomal protein S18 acetylase RimI-like enzyme
MSPPTTKSSPGYRLISGPPSTADYLALRLRSGLSPKTEAQATPALRGSWCAYHVVHEESGATVGMGRVISDGGWYFHIIDVAVLPEHQRKGLGDLLMGAIMERIRKEAGPGAYVNLLADPPGRSLYRKHGFFETAPGEVGMGMWLK